MDYTAIGRTSDYYASRKRKNALSKILAESYEPGQSVPFVDEAAQYMGAESPEGMVARVDPGQINVKNAIARLAQSGDGETALALQQAMEARQDKLMNASGGRGEYYVPVQTAEGIRSFDSRRGTFSDPMLNGKPVIGSTSDVNLQANLAGAKEGAKTAAELTAKDKTAAQIDWPKLSASGDELLKLTDELVGHKGKKYAVGAASIIPKIPGTEQANFITRMDQIGGKQFLEAFQTLKGGGQITEVEGKKATDAIARMNRAQTVEEFDSSVKDFQDVVELGLQRAAKKAGASYSPRGKKTQKQKTRIPTGAKLFMDNQTGREVFTTDGQTYFDAVTGKRVE